jgi:Fic family protein
MKPVKKAANNATKSAAAAGDELVTLMEPTLVGETAPARIELEELAFRLNQEANRLAGRLAPAVTAAIGDLVRSMNCYYSNLIEGHYTHPIDIERAMARDFAKDAKQRDLQKEAVAHIKVQTWIDDSGADGIAGLADLASEIHRRFCAELPESMLLVELPSREKIRLIPGAWRERDVAVGRHVAISHRAVPRFMKRWEEVYALKPGRLLPDLGGMHHRFLWIHPFLDGNGRTVRLLTHQRLRRIGIGSPLWAISRGLARNVDRYKALLQAADEARRGDLDGRGSLSEAALVAFNRFFLEQALDQVVFMAGLVEPARLLDRIMLHVGEEIRAGNLMPGSDIVIREVFYRGEMPRRDLEAILGRSERTRARIFRPLVERKMLQSNSHRGPVRLRFAAENAERWMPGLFPAK